MSYEEKVTAIILIGISIIIFALAFIYDEVKCKLRSEGLGLGLSYEYSYLTGCRVRMMDKLIDIDQLRFPETLHD